MNYSGDHHSERGCQLLLVFKDEVNEGHGEITERGVICDLGKRKVMPVSRTPLYNAFKDVWKFVDIFRKAIQPEQNSKL